MAKAKTKPPVLEWIASAIGLLLTLGVVAVIARDAFNGSAGMAPDIEVVVREQQQVGSRWLVRFEAHNRSPVTAAQVTIEGALPGGETSTATIDYIPGRSTRGGGLVFSTEPRGVRLRPLGFQDP
ncbi:MAG TPA: hypothetical protein VEC11_09340 [Allosphingosinicella sp.]|nr:hypothetical protein [Allosphingosinicella sp.]